MSNNIKRVITSLILLPIVLGIFILDNKYVIDIFVSLVASRCIYELFKAFKHKGYHPVEPLGYIASFSICFLHIIPKEYILILIGLIITVTILVSFLLIIAKRTKTNVIDVAITFFCVCYAVIFLMFVPIIRINLENGMWIMWYIFITAWGTDILAYETGRRIGKHHFTEVSPNKTLEGCVGGIIGAVLGSVVYTIVLNYFNLMHINYLLIIVISIGLSIIGQIGDLSASAIKRYVGIKDFSNLIPGHGGMLDRIDSVIFIAPFVYFIFMLI